MSRSAKRFGPALIGMVLWLSATAALRGIGATVARPTGKPASFRMTWLIAAVMAGLLAATLLCGALLSVGRDAAIPGVLSGDDAPALMIRYGCAGCHTIPGVPGARGQAGPSLAGFAGRLYVGGAATNNGNNLVRWLVNPRALDPRTAMPVTGISENEARAVAAYLLRMR
jgi:cytochrome c